MIVSDGDHSSYTIVVSPPGTDRCFLHFPGANHTFRAADIRDEQLAGAAWLHFGYPPLMRSIYERNGAELVTIFERAHAAGLVTSLDMAVPDPNAPSGRVDWLAWLANVLPHVDVFLPSLDETLFMLDRERFRTFSGAHDKPLDETLPREMAGRLLDMGVAVVGLKLGDAGFYVRTQKRGHSTFMNSSRRDPRDSEKSRMSPFLGADWGDCEVRTPCFEVEVCGTTGAGDATIAGFIAAIVKGLESQLAAKMAVAVGACSVEAPDASSGVPAWEAVVTRVQSGWPLRSAR
jgi:sugar/nucleoside kinase (ribokinase family)